MREDDRQRHMRSHAIAQSSQQPKATATFTPLQHGLLQFKDVHSRYPIAGDECVKCDQKDVGTLQRAAVSPSSVNSVPPTGHNFSQIRVHTDEKAADSMRAMNALSNAIGRDYRRRVLFDPRIHPRLPNQTPAWTE